MTQRMPPRKLSMEGGREGGREEGREARTYLSPTMDANTVSLRESRSQKPPIITNKIPLRKLIIGSRSPSGTCP